MMKRRLYDLPKDMLVKLVSTVEDDIRKQYDPKEMDMKRCKKYQEEVIDRKRELAGEHLRELLSDYKVPVEFISLLNTVKVYKHRHTNNLHVDFGEYFIMMNPYHYEANSIVDQDYKILNDTHFSDPHSTPTLIRQLQKYIEIEYEKIDRFCTDNDII